jgi:SAM-dependent methyltransferase
MTSTPQIFDVDAYRARRARAAASNDDAPFLADASAEAIAQRLGAVNRQFATALDVGSRSIAAFAGRAVSWTRVDAGEHLLLGKAEEFDLATSVLALHAVNDLPGVLVQIRRTLRPDGLFMAALFGGETLGELRQAFAAAEADVLGGASPRVAPFADVRDLGHLLQRAGFALPVADVERTVVRYRDLTRLFADLRELGETNVLAGRSKRLLSRRLLGAVAREYAERFADPDGRLRATFDVIYVTGWAPHESQQKPLRPGSAKTRLADALGSKDVPAGESDD